MLTDYILDFAFFTDQRLRCIETIIQSSTKLHSNCLGNDLEGRLTSSVVHDVFETIVLFQKHVHEICDTTMLPINLEFGDYAISALIDVDKQNVQMFLFNSSKNPVSFHIKLIVPLLKITNHKYSFYTAKDTHIVNEKQQAELLKLNGIYEDPVLLKKKIYSVLQSLMDESLFGSIFRITTCNSFFLIHYQLTASYIPNFVGVFAPYSTN